MGFYGSSSSGDIAVVNRAHYNSTIDFWNALVAGATSSTGVMGWYPDGTWNEDCGIINRTTLAHTGIKIIGQSDSGVIIKANVGVSGQAVFTTSITDPAYWFTGGSPFNNARKIAPIAGFTLDCENLVAGQQGIVHGPGVGGYYEVSIINATALPSDNGVTITASGAIGFAMFNGTDTNGGARWTEETVFGPRMSITNCYIGCMFDAKNGTKSFAYTHMPNIRIQPGSAGQTAFVVRNSVSAATGANLYNSEISVKGNMYHVVGGLGTVAGSYYAAQKTLGVLSIAPSGNDTITIGTGTLAACRGGDVVQLGTDSTHLVTIAATHGVGTNAEYAYYPAGTTTAIPITAVYAGTAGLGDTAVTANGAQGSCILGTITGRAVGPAAVASLTLDANLPFKVYEGQIIRVTDLSSGSPPVWAQLAGQGAPQINGCQAYFMVSGLNLTGQTVINVYSRVPTNLRQGGYTFNSTNPSPYNVVTVELMVGGWAIGQSGNGTATDASNLDGELNWRVENGSNHNLSALSMFISATASLNANGAFINDRFTISPVQADGSLGWNGPFLSVAYVDTSNVKHYEQVGANLTSHGLIVNGAIELAAPGIGSIRGYPTDANGGLMMPDSQDGITTFLFTPTTGNVKIRPNGFSASTTETVFRSSGVTFNTPIVMVAQKISGLSAGTVSGDAMVFGLNSLDQLAAAAASYNMGGFKITNALAGTVSTDVATLNNSLDQLKSPVANINMNSQKLTSLNINSGANAGEALASRNAGADAGILIYTVGTGPQWKIASNDATITNNGVVTVNTVLNGQTPNIIVPQHTAGQWYPFSANANLTSTQAFATINRPVATPFIVWKAHTYQALGWRVNANPNATKMRAAIVTDNGSFQPSQTLVWESNAQVTLTAASSITYNLSAGVFQGGFSATLQPGIYWLIEVPQVSITGYTGYGPAVNTIENIETLFFGMTNVMGGNNATAMVGNTDVTGAYPTNYAGTWALTNSVPQTSILA